MKPANIGLLAAIALWVLASLAATQFKRSHDLMEDFGSRSLFSDSGPYTANNWLTSSRTGFTCLFLSSVNQQNCGMNIQLGDGWRKGVYVEHYQTIRLAVEYQGSAEKFRVNYRNATQAEAEVYLSKFHELYLPIRKGAYVYDIPLKNMQVAEWWLGQHNSTDKALLAPERNNVIHIGFDIENPMPVGQHFFNVMQFELLTPLLSSYKATAWAAGSAVYLLIVGLIFNYFRLRSALKERSEEMFGLLHRLEKAGTESAHFKKLSMYDPLTTLLNRRAALDLVEEYARHKSLSGTALILLDIDHFKQVNDTYGHDLGDEVLKTVGAATQQLVREEDAAVRWGGEEIVIICPKTSPDGAMRVAEKLRLQLKGLRFSNPELRISASFGVVNIQPGESFDSAFKRADEALYRAKHQGRDQICQHGQ